MGLNCILFDLDGTLVDSVPDLHQAVSVALDAVQYPAVSETQTRHWVGNGVNKLIQRALSGQLDPDPVYQADHPVFQQALTAFSQYYQVHYADQCQPYAGVITTLQQLQQQGYTLGIVTNKPETFTRPLLQKLQLQNYFQVVVGGDTLPQLKPQPEPLWHAIQHCQASPATTLMVGDSRSDILAARHAGVKIAAMRYGYNHGVDISESSPDWVCDQMSEILAIIHQLNQEPESH